jgi:transglutaminase-like putative cysteine protease
VETGDVQPPVAGATWADLGTEEVRDRHTEMLEFTAYVGRDKELAKVARVLRKEPTPVDAVHAACRWVHEHLTYQRGTTGVHTSAPEAWEAGKGVCQDYVHLTLLLLREAGVPARYVSGYLLPDAQAQVRQTVTGESHAWIEAWTGGWWGYDPTNLIDIGNRHVWVATGRDYADVPPLKGIYSGGTASALDVTVAMTRLA